MKKGTLKKEGKYWKIYSPEQKIPMVVPGDFGLTEDMLGKDIEFDNSGGPIKSIRYNEKLYSKKQAEPHRESGLMKKPARAPYNFVPINENVISSTGFLDLSYFKGLSGIINIKIEVIRPLFIRGNDGLFCKKNGELFIPGSSIRGMIRNLLNIVSYGKFDQYTNKVLYRRSTLNDDGGAIESGFLTYENGKFLIYKATASQLNGINLAPFTYRYESGEDTCIFSTGVFQGRPKVWKFTKVSSTAKEVDKGTVDGYESDSTRSEEAVNIVKSLSHGKIVDNNTEHIGDVTIPHTLGIPVFYRIDGHRITSFGHAKYHRIPYSLAIRDHVIQEGFSGLDFCESIFGTLSQTSKVFFEDCCLEGEAKYELCEPKKPKILSSPKPTTYQHYLEQPDGVQTPHSKQNKWSHPNVLIRGYKNYWHRQTSSKESDPNTWIETGPPTKSNPDEINPISPESFFSGFIRFENLTNEELGSLLFVLELPEGCCHKLGMGKPLGLGSIRISVNKLSIIDRKERYKTLSDENSSWQTGKIDHTSNLNKFKDEFAKYICDNLHKSRYDEKNGFMNLWNDENLKQLKLLLTLKHDMTDALVDWEERTRYMEIERTNLNEDGNTNQVVNEYKQHPVLPLPDEVVNKETYTEK